MRKNIYTRQVWAIVCLEGHMKAAAARLILHFGCDDAQRAICIRVSFKAISSSAIYEYGLNEIKKETNICLPWE